MTVAVPILLAAGLVAPEPSAELLGGLEAWVVPNRCAEGDRVLILLHGYGSTRRRVAKLARDYAQRHCAALVFPLAPSELNKARRAWWRAPASVWRQPATHWEQPPPGLGLARARVMDLLAEVRARWGVNNQDIVLAGFSQGATLAVEVAREQEQLGGLLLLGGRFVGWSGAVPQRLADAVIANGRFDRISPQWAAVELRDQFERTGITVTWLGYDGGHRPPRAIARRFHSAVTAALES